MGNNVGHGKTKKLIIFSVIVKCHLVGLKITNKLSC